MSALMSGKVRAVADAQTFGNNGARKVRAALNFAEKPKGAEKWVEVTTLWIEVLDWDGDKLPEVVQKGDLLDIAGKLTAKKAVVNGEEKVQWSVALLDAATIVPRKAA